MGWQELKEGGEEMKCQWIDTPKKLCAFAAKRELYGRFYCQGHYDLLKEALPRKEARKDGK